MITRKKKNLILFFFLAIFVSLLLTGCGKSEAVKSVENQIEEIDEEVTLASGEKIIQVEKAYEELPDNEKKSVSSLDKLEAAKEKLNNLVEEREKELYDILKQVALQETTEMTYLLTARDFTRNAPTYEGLPPMDALAVTQSYWGDYMETMSVLGISVSDQDMEDAFLAYSENPEDVYEGGKKSNGVKTQIHGMLLATDEKSSISIAKKLFDAKYPLDNKLDYGEALGEKSDEIISELSFLEGDTDYDLLVDLHKKETQLLLDLVNILSGEDGEYEQNLNDCREVSLACEEKFGK